MRIGRRGEGGEKNRDRGGGDRIIMVDWCWSEGLWDSGEGGDSWRLGGSSCC